MNITEDYCSFEVAKLLKEKGFEILTGKVYDNQNKLDYQNVICWQEKRLPYISAPTLQMAMKWLRETHRIDIVIEISDPSVRDRKYYCMIWDRNNNSHILDLFNSYEEAAEAALKYSLENLI